MLSTETVAPLQDSMPADSARSTVEFLHQATSGFVTRIMTP